MTSFGLFSVNQLSSHPHVSRTNYATAMDAQDRLQKLHDPNAFQAANPSGRLGRILDKHNGANAGDQGMDEPMSAESSALEGHTLPEDNLEEDSAGAVASFLPIQPRQGVVPTMASPMPAVPVAHMSTQGPPQPNVMSTGAPLNPLHGLPQQPLVPRYLDNRPQQAFYVPLQPNALIPQDVHASQHASPHYRPADSSPQVKRKRGRPKREDSKNVSTAPLLPYPPPPLAAHPLQAPVFVRPHPSQIMSFPPPEAHSHSQAPQSRDSAQSPSQSSVGSPDRHSAHLQYQEDPTQLKRKRGRPKKTDPNVGAIDPSLSNVPIVLDHQALRDPDAPATVQQTSISLSGDDAHQSSEAEEDLPYQQNFLLNEPAARASTLPSTHNPTSAKEGHAAIIDLNYSNTTAPQPDQNFAEEHAPSAPNQKYPEDSATAEPPTSAQPDQQAGLSHEVPQPQEAGIPPLSQKKKLGRPRKSVANSHTPQPQIESQPGNPPGFAEHEAENAQSHSSESAMLPKRSRGRPKILDPETEAASPLPLRPPPEKLSETMLSSDDEGETPDPLSFDALIRADGQPDFNPEKSFAENSERLDSALEDTPQPNLEHIASTQNKSRGRPKKSGLFNPNTASSLPVSLVPDEEEHWEIAQTTEIQMSLTKTAQGFRSKETKVVQSKEQVKESLPGEKGSTGSQSKIKDHSMPPKKQIGRPKKSGDKIVPTWAAQPDELADSPQIFNSSPSPQEEDNANSILPKKSRGRPRKSALPPNELKPSSPVPEPHRSPSADNSQASESADEGISPPPAKKPRGRPRKSEPIVRMIPSWGFRPEGLQNPPSSAGTSPQVVHSPAPETPLLMKSRPGRPQKVDSINEAGLSPQKMQSPPDDDEMVGLSQDAMQLDTSTQSLKRRPGRPRKSDTANGVVLTPLRKETRPVEHDSVSPLPQSPPQDGLAQEIKRKRGRPSKAVMEEQASEAAKQELHPGSPLASKSQIHEAAQSPELAAGSSVPQKRRRGRPSKVDMLVMEGENTTQAQDEDAMPTPLPAKRRPGRPRKSKGGDFSASGEGGEPQSCVVQ